MWKMKSFGQVLRETIREDRQREREMEREAGGQRRQEPAGEIYGYAPNPSDRPVFIEPPDLGVEFELTIRGDNSEHRWMVDKLAGSFKFKNYRYYGLKPKKEGRQTRRFKLVKVGYRPDVSGICREVARQGMYTPESQWLEAFRRAYPVQGERPGIGIANPDWEGHYPVLHCNSSGWYYCLRRPEFCSEHWIWLVGCETRPSGTNV